MPVNIVKGYLIELLMRVKPGMRSADVAWHRITVPTVAELAAFSWANVKSKQADNLLPKGLFRRFLIAIDLLICDVSNIVNIDQSAKQNWFAT